MKLSRRQLPGSGKTHSSLQVTPVQGPGGQGPLGLSLWLGTFNNVIMEFLWITVVP